MLRKVARKVILLLLALATAGFIVLTLQRMMLDYNANGVYFDGMVTYDTDARDGYAGMACVLFLITVGTALLWKEKNPKDSNL